MSSVKTKSTLRLLAETILNAVIRVEDQFEKVGLDFPSLEDPFDPSHPTSDLIFKPEVAADVALVVAATEQLAVSIGHPITTSLDAAMSFHKCSCLQAATVTNVPEILREAGPKGLHVNDISKINGINPNKISRVLRVLATNHIFTEVEPNVFANNRISSTLDTLKSTSELFSKPRKEKQVGAAGVASFVELITDEYFKMSAFMTEALLDPRTGHTDSPTDTAFNIAFNTPDSWWTWLNRPENEYRNIRFVMAMDSTRKVDKNSILEGFPWDSLPDGSKVVDVGGGAGSSSITIASKFPKFKYVLQDQPHVIKNAPPVWNERLPGFLESGQLLMQEHNFLSQQPIKDADIFLLRVVIHNWNTSDSIKILRHLRDAAVVGKTRLLLIELVVDYACKPPSNVYNGIILPPEPSVPEFMLPNLGRAFNSTYYFDVQMFDMLQGEERTLDDHIKITSASGWKITHVYAAPGSVLKHILAEAV